MKGVHISILLIIINIASVLKMTEKLGDWSKIWSDGWFFAYVILAVIFSYICRNKTSLGVFSLCILFLINGIVLDGMEPCSYGCESMPGIGFILQLVFLFIVSLFIKGKQR